MAKKNESLKINYIKTPDYRTIHCDGAWGGVSRRGYINFTVYSERNAVPVLTEKIFDANGVVVEEKTLESKEGIVRSLEATLFMDLNASREFYTWFGVKLALLEDVIGIPEEERTPIPHKKDEKDDG